MKGDDLETVPPTPTILLCPVCDQTLSRFPYSFQCDRGHAFDVTREGYVNLLLHQRSGDTRAMLEARRRFLESGHYAPLACAIAGAVERHLTKRLASAKRNSRRILDAGCGEGYYLGRLMEHLDNLDLGIQVTYFGVDVSKAAVRLGAKRYQRPQFVVGDLWTKAPVASGSIDVALNVFAPRNPKEFARMLAPGGLLIVVIPQPDHLRELRAAYALLGIEEQKREHVIAQLESPPDGAGREGEFRLSDESRLEYEMELSGDDLRNLLDMAPTAFHPGRHTPLDGTELPPTRSRAAFAMLAFRRSLDFVPGTPQSLA